MRKSDNPAGAIYGTIVVLAAIAGGGAARGIPLGTILGGAIASGLVFWLAHVYTEVIAARVGPGTAPLGADIRHAMREHSPILEAVFFPGAVLLLGVIGVLERETAINLALAAGLVDLFAWGVAQGRANGLPNHQVVMVGVVDLMLGVVIVGLKLLLQH
jgi:hypothetical protein